jgi:two-component system sensor histidine kinase UhpB
LEEALAELAEETNKSNGLLVKLANKTGDLKGIEKKIQLMLYRIVQVQLNNIIEHANAVTATISLATKDETLYLSVTDDGMGFDANKQLLGLDLQNVKNRVEFYNGEMNIISSPGKGCMLEISIPLQPDQSV